MNDDSWRLVKSTFSAALEAKPEEREAIVERMCAGSSDARREVRRMLRHAIGEGSTVTAPPSEAHTGVEQDLHTIDRFEIIERIGEGASGIVYRALDTNHDRVVAVKLLRPSAADTLAAGRLAYEGALLRGLEHDGLARVFAVGSIETVFGTLPYLAMDLVAGEPINAYARKHRLDDEGCLRLILEVCRAVGYAHSRGVIHRDLKPANILVPADGHPRVIDFGIAGTLARDRTVATSTEGTARVDPPTIFTHAGDLMGTPGYMSPEQAAGDAERADTRADVYALGVILFELLVGERLFVSHGLPLHDALRVMARAEPPLIGAFRPGLRGDIEAVLARAMARHPCDRYDAASSLADDIERLLDGRTVSAPPVSRKYRTRRALRRHRRVVAAAAVVLAMLLATIAWQQRRARIDAARVDVMHAVLRIMAVPDLSTALGYESDYRAAIDRSRLTPMQRVAFEDMLANRLLNGFGPAPEARRAAVRHFEHARALTVDLFGRKDERSIRALQVLAEGLCMSDQAERARTLAADEIEFWGFSPENLSSRTDRQGNLRLLRLASTYGEALARVGRTDEAIAYLRRVLLAQQAVFGPTDAEHSDVQDTRALIDALERP